MSGGVRNWLVVTASIGGVALASALVGSLTERQASQPRRATTPSVFFSDRHGARALFLVAQELLPSVQPWRRPLTQLSEAQGTLVVAGPSEPLSPAEADSLEGWINGGGQLVLAIDKDWEVREGTGGFLSRLDLQVDGAAEAERAVQSVRVAWEAEPLRLRLARGCAVRGEGREVAQVGDDAVVLARTQGRGRIVVVPDASFCSNDSLRGSDNAALVVALCSQRDRAVLLFDEYHHGFGESRGLYALMGELMTTPWGWTLATAGVAGALYVFGCRRRFGRVVERAEPSRESPMETVDARAGLFRVARANTLAIDSYCTDMEVQLGRSLGRQVDLATLAREREGSNSIRQLIALRDRGRQGRERMEESDVLQAARLAGRVLEEMSLE